ncbi:MAG: thioredoxin family protein, partial [Cyanobacteria bacterium P01_F01_bin.42]
IYRGQLDDARPGNDAPVTGRDMRAAIDAGLTGAILPAQKPSIGCNIKWKPGNEPAYAL